ncbi:MAG TPA: copper resistance protein CopC, partial [Gaiellaceae bacterium]
MQCALEGEEEPPGFPPSRLLLVAACVALVAAAGAPSASAHARLLRTVPAQGAVLGRAPGKSTFLFDEAVRSAAPARISGGSLNGAVTAPARLEPGGRRLVVTLPRGLGRGVYAVAWRAVSDDGHVETGTLVFGVGVRPTGISATASSSTPTDWPLTLARWAFLYGLLAAAGLGAARLAL